MTDVSFFWIAFVAYLCGMFALSMAALRREAGQQAARLGRALIALGLLSQTVSIVWRAFLLGTEPLHQFLPRLKEAFAGGTWQATVYVLLLVVPLLAIVVGVLFRRQRIVWLLAAGVAVMVELILLDFLDFTRLPIEKVYEYLSIASWALALALLAISPVIRLMVIDAALAVMTALLAVFAAIHPHDIELALVPALQSYWLFIHVSLTAIGFAIFGIAYIVATMLLVKTYDGREVSDAARRRSRWAIGLALLLGAVLVAALAGGGIILPFGKVAYAPHQLEAADGPPPAGMAQHARYGAALLGAGATAAYVLYWALYALLRPKGHRSGRASYQFAISSTALFVGCLVLAGLIQRQEMAIVRVYEQRNELVRLHNQVIDSEGRLTGTALTEQIERMEELAAEARHILAEARWLPLSFENQARHAEEPAYQALQDLYARTGTEWTLPIRYKDIKQIGRRLSQRAATARAVVQRLDLPADREDVAETVDALTEEGKEREEAAILPRTQDGKIAAFAGLGFLVAIPFALAFHLLGRRVRDRLPDPARLDRISYVAVAVAYPIFTFGALFAGAIWAHFAWGTWWGWDPKEVGSLVAWVLYTIYLHQRYREGLSPRAAAVAAMLGFLAAVLSLAGNTFLGGLHAYG